VVLPDAGHRARRGAGVGAPELARFFARSWIPDEFAIQSIVAGLQAPERIAGHSLTYYEFDAQGKPLVLEDWHADHVARQPFFFARKVSPDATRLEARLDEAVASREIDRGWFARAGVPTPEFEHHLARVRTDPSLRSRVGSFPVEAGGPMGANTRRYYVVARIVAAARRGRPRARAAARRRSGRRADPRLPVRPHRAATRPGALAMVRHRAGRSPACAVMTTSARLYELVQLDPRWCTAFGLDVVQWSRVRDFVARDPNAVLVDCDPPGLTRAQRAAMALQHMGRRTRALAVGLHARGASLRRSASPGLDGGAARSRPRALPLPAADRHRRRRRPDVAGTDRRRGERAGGRLRHPRGTRRRRPVRACGGSGIDLAATGDVIDSKPLAGMLVQTRFSGRAVSICAVRRRFLPCYLRGCIAPRHAAKTRRPPFVSRVKSEVAMSNPSEAQRIAAVRKLTSELYVLQDRMNQTIDQITGLLHGAELFVVVARCRSCRGARPTERSSTA
jgi:hypothetical protein